jgi:hypothetical protein
MWGTRFVAEGADGCGVARVFGILRVAQNDRARPFELCWVQSVISGVVCWMYLALSKFLPALALRVGIA